MHTKKRYTNTTFTRRVDHVAGRHRAARTPAGVQACSRCGAVHVRDRWMLGGSPAAETLKGFGDPQPVVCPACRMAADGGFGGEVRLGGTFLEVHREEIAQLIAAEAARAAEDNPLARILEMSLDQPDHIVLRTTTEHLAKRLGQAVKKAYDGKVHYGFSHENKFAHVTWTRDV